MPPDLRPTVAECLAEGLDQLGLEIPAAAQARLCAYLALLEKWGAVYNLTAIRDPAQALVHHVLDALAILAPLRARCDLEAGWVVDLGSGAGVPGLVLAIVEPRMRLWSVDAVGKKIAFQRQVCAELGLTHVEVQAARIETLRRSCSLVLSRAWASIGELYTSAAGLIGPATIVAAMKGQRTEIMAELAQLDARYATEIVPLAVPGLQAERHLVLVREPVGSTSQSSCHPGAGPI